MIRIMGRKSGLSVERIWYPDNGPVTDSKADIIRYLKVEPTQLSHFHGAVTEVYTQISDLRLSEEDLLMKMNKDYRYMIRRAQRDGTEVTTFDAAALRTDASILEDFEQTYMDFCDSMKNEELKKDFDREKIESYIEHNCILLTKAVLGSAVAYHLYVTDGNWANMSYSASNFRDGNIDSAAAGRMNKMLHWHDMLFLKQQGCQKYDWGGLSSLENYNGIDTFKTRFGGEPKTLYNISVGNTPLGKIAVAVLRMTKH